MRGERRVRDGPRRAQRAAEAGIEIDRRQLLPREPPEGPRLRGQAAEARVAGRDDQVAKIQVPVRRLVARAPGSGGRRRRGAAAPSDAAPAPRCPSPLGPPGSATVSPLPLPRLGVAAGLEPSAELPVVEQEHLVPRRRDDHCAPREVPLDDAAVERIGMAVDEREDLGQVRRFLRDPPARGAEEGAERASRERARSRRPVRRGSRRRGSTLATWNAPSRAITVSSTVGRRDRRCQPSRTRHAGGCGTLGPWGLDGRPDSRRSRPALGA